MARVEAHAGLGDNVVPEGYRITIEPDLRTFAFKGSETISVEVKRPTKAIRLNSKKIKVKSASVFSSGKIQKASISYFRGREEISLSIEKPVSGRNAISE